MKARRLEFNDRISHKFWEISRNGISVTTRWGRMGTPGQFQKKEFDSAEAAIAYCEKSVTAKTKKGYREYARRPKAREVKASLEGELDAGPRRVRMPGYFTKALKTWLDLKRLIGSDCVNSESVRAIDSGFQRASWAWRPTGRVVRFSEVDRLGQNFCGPPYTCEGFEWPLSATGYPYLPLIQLDLDKASKTCGVDIGSGLLQLFETKELRQPLFRPYFMRQVPRAKINRASMLPVPEWAPSQIERLKTATGGHYFGELEADYTCIQVRKFEKKAFSFPRGMFWGELGDLDGEALGVSAEKCAFFNEKVSQLAGSLESIDELYGYGTATHLFGSFRSIQYEPEESRIPLFCIDGAPFDIAECEPQLAYRFELGDNGNGQIFIEQDKSGKARFQFEWSCY
jgi:predicted DNA-binding WGR domain protein